MATLGSSAPGEGPDGRDGGSYRLARLQMTEAGVITAIENYIATYGAPTDYYALIYRGDSSGPTTLAYSSGLITAAPSNAVASHILSSSISASSGEYLWAGTLCIAGGTSYTTVSGKAIAVKNATGVEDPLTGEVFYDGYTYSVALTYTPSGGSPTVDTYPATVRSGSTGNSYTTTGLTSVTAISIGTLAATSISDTTGDGTHSVPALVDGVAHELYGTKTVTVTGTEGSPTISTSFQPATGNSFVTLSGTLNTTNTGGLYNFSPAAVAADQIVFPSSGIAYDAQGNITGEAGSYSCWHIQASTKIARSYTVTLGGSSDTTPDSFTFTDQTGVALSTLIESSTITVSGIDAAAAISVTGGEYAVNTGSGFGAYTSTSATVANGNTVKVRHTSSGSFSTAVNTVLTIGGVSDTFTTTTLAADTTPNAFTFTDVTNASLSTEYTSNSITVAGLNTSSAISISGGTYSKNGGAYTASSGTVVNGDAVTVRVTSSATNSTSVGAVLTIGGISDTYTVTTLAAVYVVDPVVDSTISSKVQIAFALDRVVQGYTGNTANLRRASDNATAEFGFDSNGIFNVSAVSAWAAGSTVTVVSLIDQVSGTKLFTATNAPVLMTAGVVQRLGTDYNETTGLMTPNGLGAVGIPLGTNGYFTLAASGITAGSGLEFHTLHQHLSRYGHTTQIAIGDGAVRNDRETLFSYGVASNNYFLADYNNASLQEVVSRITSLHSGSSPTGTAGGIYKTYKKHSNRVVTHVDIDGFIRRYEQSAIGKEVVKNANDNTASSQANFSNGQLRVGNGYTITAARNGTFLFGAIIVTTALTDFERTMLQKKLALTAEHHLTMTRPQFLDAFDEIVDFRDYNAGVLTGKKGKLTLNFNTAGASWVPNYTAPAVGLSGLRAPAGTNASNTFVATDDYFVNATESTVFVYGQVEYLNSFDWWGIQTAANAAQRPMLGPGFDHVSPRLTTQVDASIDTQGWSGPAGWTDACGGTISQAEVKYAGMKITTGDWKFTETTTADCTLNALWGSDFIPTGTVLDGAGVRARQSTAEYPGPRAPAPEQDQGYVIPEWTGRGLNYSVFTAATVKPHPNFNFTSATQAYVKSATNKIFASNGVGFSVGQTDASIGIGVGNHNHYAPGTETGYRIRSIFQSRSIQGTVFFWGFVKRAMTLTEVKQVELNFHKLYIVDDAPPVMPADTSANAAENQTAVGTFVVSSGTAPITYSLSGSDAALFSINSSTGAVAFLSAPNFESGSNTKNITVTATNAFGSDSQNITVNVTNVVEVPVMPADNTYTVIEGQTVVGNPGASFVDGSITYSKSGTNQALFNINSSTGALTFASPATIGSYSVTVTATNSAGNDAQNLTVNVITAPVLSGKRSLFIGIGKGIGL